MYMHGVVNLDKPKGMTSQQAVTRVKRLLKIKKAGHAGTLDPMATGVLLVCVGEATKISSLLMDMPKTYEAQLTLGVRTDTLDAEGEVTERRQVQEYPMPEIEKALSSFVGIIKQVPPMYSAIKQNGKPLYKLAREGKTVERKEREVSIYSIECTGYEHPLLRIRVSCSKGTYIRTLAEDIAGRLGTCAHLSALRRTRVGEFMADNADTLDATEGGEAEGPGFDIVPVDHAISSLEEVVLSHEDHMRAGNGGFINAAGYQVAPGAGTLRLKGPEGDLLALGSMRDGHIKVDRLLHLKG